jgi:hypothetical protein
MEIPENDEYAIIKKINVTDYSIDVQTNIHSKNIEARVSKQSQCCEDFGVEISSNHESFVGSRLHNVIIGDVKYGDSEEVFIEIKIETSKGEFTIKLYNIHNGYYPHDAQIISENVNTGFQL